MREMLVLDIESNEVLQVGFANAGLKRPARLKGGNIDRLTGPMHYAALARAEPSAVVALVQSWIALEHLAYGRGQNEPPGKFVPDAVAEVVRLVAVRHLISGSYLLLHQELRVSPPALRGRGEVLVDWLEGSLSAPVVDLQRWLDVLVALGRLGSLNGPASPIIDEADTQAAALLLRELMLEGSVYARRRIDEVASLVADPKKLIAWSITFGRRAKSHADRLRRLRNQIVHGSLPDVSGAREGAEVGRQLLDAVFEVLPYWLDGRSLPWRGLDGIAEHRGALFKEWAQGVPIEMAAIARPPSP